MWNSEFDQEEGICYFDLNIFTQNPDGTYTRRDEFQEERAYSVEDIKKTVEECNLELLGVYDNLSFNPLTDQSERLFFVVRRK